MRATEELRRLLDERGIEWTQGMAWNVTVINGDWLVVEDVDFGTLSVSTTAYQLTPEQAIAATLGDDADAVAFCKRIEKAAESREPLTLFGVDYYATLGDGECAPHGEWESISQTQEVRHVFCECGFELGMDRRDSLPFKCTKLFAMPNFCPECGRKIRKAVKR